MKDLKFQTVLFSSCILFLSIVCFSDKFTELPKGFKNSSAVADNVPAVYKKIYSATDIYIDGNYVVIKTNGLPDHKSPYYQNTQWEADMNEDYNGKNTKFRLNPNRITKQRFTFKLPLNPVASTKPRATPLGPMGVSINGVPFYNQYAGPNNKPLTSEINSFDQYYGHPDGGSRYHYHAEPFYLTKKFGKEALLGFLLDGFPVYGPMENGVVATNLDAYHGHNHATLDFPEGTYHYHATLTDPYINGSGFYGNVGTVSN